MKLTCLPVSSNGAVANMAMDHWMLGRLESEGGVGFRHYGWTEPAFTFGYPQSLEAVRVHVERLTPEAVALCRRPTGGGIVDHRADWTYALALHRSCAWGALPPLVLYHELHACLQRALEGAGAPALRLYEPVEGEVTPHACFERPSPYDLIRHDSGLKVAGAALKRTREGVLIQGSLSRQCLEGCDFDRLTAVFADALMHALHLQVRVDVPLPMQNEWLEHYASKAWLERR
jgi:lipoyl(octanoyl) transferase